MLVKAGAPVESTIDLLMPLLEKGDIIIDGGNEWYENTEHRQKKVAEKGLMYLGMGVSGGEEGARNGELPISFKSAKFHLCALASCQPKCQWSHQWQICSSRATHKLLDFTIMSCFAALYCVCNDLCNKHNIRNSVKLCCSLKLCCTSRQLARCAS